MDGERPYDARLLVLEDKMLDYRRRFRLALAGYVILLIGIVVAFYLAWQVAEDLEDTQRGTIRLVRCADHPNANGCNDLPTYKELLKETRE
jgi:hypothetical protein